MTESVRTAEPDKRASTDYKHEEAGRFRNRGRQRLMLPGERRLPSVYDLRPTRIKNVYVLGRRVRVAVGAVFPDACGNGWSGHWHKPHAVPQESCGKDTATPTRGFWNWMPTMKHFSENRDSITYHRACYRVSQILNRDI